MKFLTSIALIGSFFSYVQATCPNLCSGHGNCGANDRCTCYANWLGSDCSERQCAFGLAWADAPSSVAGTNFAHWYAECSNKGLCDRSTGECECFPGYTGKGCKRSTCPNDCSGHGTCYFIEQLSKVGYPAAGDRSNGDKFIVDWNARYGSSGASVASNYAAWDAGKIQACICDAGYEGSDCSIRQCPRGDNVLTVTKSDYNTQTITIAVSAGSPSGEFTLTFTDLVGAAYTTAPIVYSTLGSTTAAAINNALEQLPNGVVPSVTVSATSSLIYVVTFDNAANSGVQNPLIVDYVGCNRAGCAPKYNGMVSTTPGATISFSVTDNSASVTLSESAVCSEHGVCDTTTGLCKCFHGYYNLNCNEQTVLV
jgi:hypothetical protein